MKVLGISGSPRKNGTTAKLVKEILNATGLETEFISLAGKDVRPCIACLACAKDNICKVEDYVGEIYDKIVGADAFVIGGSNIYSMLNGLTHNFLERFYQFHHDDKSPIAGKPGVAVGVGGKNGEPVSQVINHFFSRINIRSLGTITTKGALPCFSCGIGHTCKISNVRNLLDKNGEIDMSFKPSLEKQEPILKEAKELGIKIRLDLEES